MPRLCRGGDGEGVRADCGYVEWRHMNRTEINDDCWLLLVRGQSTKREGTAEVHRMERAAAADAVAPPLQPHACVDERIDQRVGFTQLHGKRAWAHNV